MKPVLRRAAYRTGMFVVSIALVAVLWEVYKVVGPEKGGKLFGAPILPRSNDTAMPHVWEMLSRYAEPEQRSPNSNLIWFVVLKGAFYSFRLALVGFILGSTIGVALAALMSRFKTMERGLLPYLVISQTVPLIALAPLVVSWGGKVQIFGFTWPRWLSASVLGAFLAFFPIAVGTLRGLKSAPAASLELMESYAASWKQTLFKLKFPAAIPFMVPAFKLGASGAVIGVVVAEISTGLKGGIGRLIIEYARQATADPAKVFTAVFGAAGLGLAMAGLVALADVLLMRNRPKETTT
ncbi:MAG: ABC transporter permease subunit [Actinobacteria bacterium]|jgi:NitT/TauT family transport system permease protein|nr:ABC transporter permease subunit [Actinomycetota bacterium]MDA2951810.1 ABC transporter permease subunit [Actinomycetota bacterium]MDA2999660.1 ABC transporter permease subunit [Actinomycetota bacterium]